MRNISYFLVLLFVSGICLLNSCDVADKEDVTPQSFSQLKLTNDQFVTAVNQSLKLGIFSNDNFSTGATVRLGSPQYGTVRADSGNVTYQPKPNYTGNDSLTYSVCVGPKCDSAVVVIVVKDTVGGENPCRLYAVNDSATTVINQPVKIPVLNNDSLCGKIDLSLITNPVHGTASISPELNVIYTPKANFTGVDEFRYKICTPTDTCKWATVRVYVTKDTAVNCISRFQAYPDSVHITVPKDSLNKSIYLNVLANDSLCTTDVSLEIFQQPLVGTAVIEAENIKYTAPYKATTTRTTMTYTVCSVIDGKKECRKTEVYIKIN